MNGDCMRAIKQMSKYRQTDRLIYTLEMDIISRWSYIVTNQDSGPSNHDQALSPDPARHMSETSQVQPITVSRC